MGSLAGAIDRGVWRKILMAGALQIVTVGVNLFGLSLLRAEEGGSSTAVATAFALIFATAVLAGHFTGFLANYASARADIDLRARLMALPGIPASRANNDVSVAVGVILFYVFAPGQAAALGIYLVQLYRFDAVACLLVAGGIAAAAAPLALFVRWRGRMIGRVRQARNSLLDDHAASGPARLQRIAAYRQHYLRFVLADGALGLAFLLAMVGLVFVASNAIVAEDALAGLVLIALILLQLRGLAMAFSLFQENRKSAAAILQDLAREPAPTKAAAAG